LVVCVSAYNNYHIVLRLSTKTRPQPAVVRAHHTIHADVTRKRPFTLALPQTETPILSVAVFALLAWLIEFSTHSHSAEVTGGGSTIHCTVCAGFQVGAGPVVSMAQVAPVRPVPVRVVAPEPFLATTLPSSYRSRAPPRS
jgi:hypothetical protein